MAGDIFISYRRTRRAEAAALEHELRVHGFADYQIFRDERGLFGGDAFDRQLNDTLRRTRLVLLLVGEGDAPKRSTDDWVARELRAALAAHRPVLPVALTPGASAAVAAADWPDDLRAILETQFLTFSASPTTDEMKRLVGAIRRYGIRPMRLVDQWQELLLHNPVDAQVDQLIAFARDDHPRLVLLEGDSGTGRTHVMSRVRARLGDGRSEVAFHSGLDSRYMGRAAAVVYDWINDLLSSSELQAVPRDLGLCLDAVIQLARAGFEPLRLDPAIVSQFSGVQLSTLRSWHYFPQDLGVATSAVRTIERIVATIGRRAVLMVDDIDLCDSSSQEIVRLLALRPSTERDLIRVVLSAARGSLLKLYLADGDPDAQQLAGMVQVAMTPNVGAMLDAARFTEHSKEALVGKELSPSACAFYVRSLHERGLVNKQADGMWSVETDGVPLPDLATLMDEELDNLMPPSYQQVLEIGALLGTRFDVGVADRVASGETSASPICERLIMFDPDATIVQASSGPDDERLCFTSSTWWQHLRRRRIRGEMPIDVGDFRRLADELTAASTPNGSYDDWATVGLLHDALKDNARAGAAFLRAASAALRSGAGEAAARGFREAAHRLELNASSARPGPDCAGELFRSAYARFRSATVRLSVLATSSGDDPIDDATRSDCLAAALPDLQAVDRLLQDVESELTSTYEPAAAADFDDLVTVGADLNAEVAERLRSQARTLQAYAQFEHGRLALGPTLDAGNAAASFTRALMLAEGGVGGNVYRELVIGASAGAAYALGSFPDLLTRPELFRNWFEHSAHAAMLIASSLGIEGRARPISDPRPLLNDARGWLAAGRRAVFGSAGLTAANYPPNDERALLDLVQLLHRHGAPLERRRHPVAVQERAEQLLSVCEDLTPHRNDASFGRDLALFAWAHDAFRCTDSARLTRVWRDLTGAVGSGGGYDGAENEWHDPVLLHGKVAARWLEHDLRLRNVIGAARATRLLWALETHTVSIGAIPTELDTTTAFVIAAHLADLLTASANDPSGGLDKILSRRGGLVEAYVAAHGRRAERLQAEGRTLSRTTLALLNQRGSTTNPPEPSDGSSPVSVAVG